MATYKKNSTVGGAWAKATDVKNGTRVKLVSECEPSESEFGTQNVAKAKFEGDQETKNVRLNKPTINGLIDAFGEDSQAWIGKVLTAQTERMLVGGKRVTALYLIPEGFELGEDKGGYLTVTPKAPQTKKVSIEPTPVSEMDFTPVEGLEEEFPA